MLSLAIIPFCRHASASPSQKFESVERNGRGAHLNYGLSAPPTIYRCITTLAELGLELRVFWPHLTSFNGLLLS